MLGSDHLPPRLPTSPASASTSNACSHADAVPCASHPHLASLSLHPTHAFCNSTARQSCGPRTWQAFLSFSPSLMALPPQEHALHRQRFPADLPTCSGSSRSPSRFHHTPGTPLPSRPTILVPAAAHHLLRGVPFPLGYLLLKLCLFPRYSESQEVLHTYSLSGD